MTKKSKLLYEQISKLTIFKCCMIIGVSADVKKCNFKFDSKMHLAHAINAHAHR